MPVRYMKMVLVFFVGLQGWLYVAGNIANWNAGLDAISYVLGMSDHDIYGTHIFPPITSTAMAAVVFLLILGGEFLVGAFSFKGAVDLWKARNADAQAFNEAKTFALVGTAMAMLVWFGGFIVLGGALFQMWQTEIGAASFDGAFVYAATGGLVMLIIAGPDR